MAEAARVLIVTPQPFFEERGTPIAIAHTARALGECGYEVDLLSFPLGTPLAIPGVKMERCGNPFRFRRVKVGFSMRKALLDASLSRRFERLLARRNYHVVHAVEEAAWLAAMLCPAKSVPFIYDMASSIPEQLATHHLLGAWPVQRLLRAAERRVIGRAAHVICSGGLGPYVGQVDPHAPVSEWRYPVFDVATDPRAARVLRERLGISQLDFVVLYTGNFSGYQGLELLVEAFGYAAAVDPRLFLVCVGAADASEAGQAESQVPESLKGRVRFVLREKRATMPTWFAAADCLVSLRPSGDNIPLKLFEYMATRRPVVASRGRAHEPLLNDTRAFLCEPDAKDVAAAILRVAANPEQARAAADAAARYAAVHFNWGTFRHFVAGIYERTLHSRLAVSGPLGSRP